MVNSIFKVLLVSSFCLCIGCKNEPTGPEMNCTLEDVYELKHHFVAAGKAFDIQVDPPKHIPDLHYPLASDLLFAFNEDTVSFPYNEFFIDSVVFINDSLVDVHIFESESSRRYTYTRDDCELYLSSPGHELQIELLKGGKEMEEQRFAIFHHGTKPILIDNQPEKIDTYAFIEFRLGPFASYEEIALAFAQAHPGVYDTIGIELIENRTKE